VCSNTRLNIIVKSSLIVCETRILVSSAKIITPASELIYNGKILYMLKRRGLRTLP
jgi:hypothetical protein